LQISSKLFSDPATALKIVQAHTDIQDPGSGSYTRVNRAPASYGKSIQGQAACISLLQTLGAGYRFLSLFECEKAIKAFSEVPLPHYSTGWVLQCVGQAYFEMVDYPSAEKAFQQLRLLDPFRLEGLEIYSTVLWHMKKGVELSKLAQEAISLDRHSPVSWCIMGNCFSLEKEHERALRFFQRSLQLDPSFTYAYTLCGHEYFANEDFEKGLNCYRHAIRLSPRHYNAWFGSGHIYFRQEKYGMAEYHFRRAHHINRKSSVLKCYLGMALHKVKRTGEALQTLEQAVDLDPKNPLARFEYASVLTSLGNLEKAMAELNFLHHIVPKEASVLFQRGKVLKRLGHREEALKNFSDALDLQPPSIDANLIKAAIDRISSGKDGEDEM
jgi:anaphase-promoting complex subunit 3